MSAMAINNSHKSMKQDVLVLVAIPKRELAARPSSSRFYATLRPISATALDVMPLIVFV